MSATVRFIIAVTGLLMAFESVSEPVTELTSNFASWVTELVWKLPMTRFEVEGFAGWKRRMPETSVPR